MVVWRRRLASDVERLLPVVIQVARRVARRVAVRARDQVRRRPAGVVVLLAVV
jgi:hypothetical protein